MKHFCSWIQGTFVLGCKGLKLNSYIGGVNPIVLKGTEFWCEHDKKRLLYSHKNNLLLAFRYLQIFTVWYQKGAKER